MQKDCVGQFESIGYKFCISSLVLNASKHSASKIKTESQPCGICNNKKNVDAHFRNVNLELFCSHIIQLLGTFLRDHADTKLKQNGQQYIIFFWYSSFLVGYNSRISKIEYKFRIYNQQLHHFQRFTLFCAKVGYKFDVIGNETYYLSIPSRKFL